jgi:hypothetical protein
MQKYTVEEFENSLGESVANVVVSTAEVAFIYFSFESEFVGVEYVDGTYSIAGCGMDQMVDDYLTMLAFIG